MTEFFKYQGAGNDFIIIDNRNTDFKNNTKKISQWCDRKMGIGADGLILLEKPKTDDLDFEMVYYNADGKTSSMCGNGGRCLVHFAQSLNIFKNQCQFSAIDGLHKAKIEGEKVWLGMKDVGQVQKFDNHFFLDTGSPHHIEFVKGLDEFDVFKEGKRIRNLAQYAEDGVNVNFVELKKEGIQVRTYERGVEDETLSCGTGVTASAIAAYLRRPDLGRKIDVNTLGGDLAVQFSENEGRFSEIQLIGPATFVFRGTI